MGKGFIRNLALALWFCSSSHSLIPAGCGLLCAAESLAAVVLGFVFGFDARFLYS